MGKSYKELVEEKLRRKASQAQIDLTNTASNHLTKEQQEAFQSQIDLALKQGIQKDTSDGLDNNFGITVDQSANPYSVPIYLSEEDLLEGPDLFDEDWKHYKGHEEIKRRLEPKCSCGSAAVGSPVHSGWCDLMGNTPF